MNELNSICMEKSHSHRIFKESYTKTHNYVRLYCTLNDIRFTFVCFLIGKVLYIYVVVARSTNINVEKILFLCYYIALYVTLYFFISDIYLQLYKELNNSQS